MSVAPQPVVIQVVQSTAPRFYEKYNGKAARVLGICQIVLAVASIVFSAASIGIKIERAYSGYGIVSGIFWIIAGSFGVASASRKTACTIITTMVLSILAAVGMGSYLSTAASQITYVEYHRYKMEDKYKAGLAVSSLLVVIGVAELVVAIAAAALCCRVACCCRPQTQVAHNASSSQANQFVVMNTGNGEQTIELPAGFKMVAPAPRCEENQNVQQPPQYTGGSPPPYTTVAKY